MRPATTRLLVLFTAVGSGISWWPGFIQPGIGVPLQASLAVAALCAGLATVLGPAEWVRIWLASGLGTFIGLSAAMMIWPLSDPIARPYAAVFVPLLTVAVMLVAPVARFMMRGRSIVNGRARGAIWAAIVVCIVFGPVVLALTPTVVRHRVVRNGQLAAERFVALKEAMEATQVELGGIERICDPAALRRRYAGPKLNDADWSRITGNYVFEDDYTFIIRCRQKGGYILEVAPIQPAVAGMRWFCTDESRKVGCRVVWDSSRYKCLPCS